MRSSKASDAELKGLRAAFLADFRFLNYAWSEEAFRSAARLFLAKWSDKKYGNMFTGFLQHLQEHWLQPIRSRWYKGAAWGYVMNNGGLESQNKYFKLDATMYKKENTHKLVTETAGEWLANHAARRAAGAVNQVVPQFVFPVENITFTEWQRAYQYTKEEPVFSFLKRPTSDSFTALVLSSECKDPPHGALTTANAHLYYQQYNEPNRWTEYSHYVSVLEHTHIIHRTGDRWLCTCIKFHSDLFCKHIIHLKVTEKLIVYEERHKITVLGHRGPGKKGGRPPMATLFRNLKARKGEYSAISISEGQAPEAGALDYAEEQGDAETEA